MCRRCPLLAACREYALNRFPLYHGVPVVIAGWTESELLSERRRLGITPPPVPRPPSTQRPRPLTYTSAEEKERQVMRNKLSVAHGKGHHDPERPKVGCPRCAT